MNSGHTFLSWLQALQLKGPWHSPARTCLFQHTDGSSRDPSNENSPGRDVEGGQRWTRHILAEWPRLRRHVLRSLFRITWLRDVIAARLAVFLTAGKRWIPVDLARFYSYWNQVKALDQRFQQRWLAVSFCVLDRSCSRSRFVGISVGAHYCTQFRCFHVKDMI